MTKKLKIRFVKFERALVVQQLEIEGDFKNSPHVSTSQHDIGLFCDAVWISVGETRIMNEIAAKNFDSNRDRDEYLERVVKWISEEQNSLRQKESWKSERNANFPITRLNGFVEFLEVRARNNLENRDFWLQVQTYWFDSKTPAPLVVVSNRKSTATSILGKWRMRNEIRFLQDYSAL